MLWDVSRGTGLAALVALSAGLVLGVASVPRVSRPRFVVVGLHRWLTVAGLGVTALHVAAVVVDGYAPVGWWSAVAPFDSDYRRLWTGLGTLAVDAMVLAAVTSLRWLRRRLGHRAWRCLHALSWLCWPTAVAHGVADGTDTRARWALALTALCVAAVAAALALRLVRPGALAGARVGVVAGIRVGAVVGAPAAVTAVVALVAGCLAGPLRPGWARAAGTPAALLGGRPAPAGSAGSGGLAGSGDWSVLFQRRLARSAQGVPLTGRLDERLVPGATVLTAREVYRAALPGWLVGGAGSAGGQLTLVLQGRAFETGLDLDASRVTLSGHDTQLVGSVVGVRGTSYRLAVAGAGGRSVNVALTVVTTGPTSWRGTLRTID